MSPRVLSPSQLNRLARSLLEDGIGLVWLEAEVSGFTRAASGHWYFQLKDAQAQLRAVMFRNVNFRLPRPPANGDRVLARGRISLFEARGDFQFLIEQLQPAGLGEILLAFEQLKARLAAEGCFEPARKRPLPALPRRLDLITSAQGAALHDVLQVLRRRWPALQIRIFETAVQGVEAPFELRRALAAAATAQPAADLCLLTRGGGAREDLAAFDDEVLARAILAHPVPVISAVGHETDTTIADLVADLRAPTPSAAAEMLSPDQTTLRQRLGQYSVRLQRQVEDRLLGLAQRLDRALLRSRPHAAQQRLARLAADLQSHARRLGTLPGRQLQQRYRELGQLQRRLQLRQPLVQLQRWRNDATALGRRLTLLRPVPRLDAASLRLQGLQRQLAEGSRSRLRDQHERLGRVHARLQGLDPGAVLSRGYALLYDQHSGALLPSASQLQPGQAIRLRLRDGEKHARVEGD